MTPPPGLQASPGLICRLQCALYGLKQAPRAWFERLSSVVVEPGTYREAVQSPEWCTAMAEELDALIYTQTWDLVTLPSHAVLITCR